MKSFDPGQHFARALERLTDDLRRVTVRFGARVDVDPREVSDRSAHTALQPPGIASANGSARIIRTLDWWIAVNLARPEDVELLPAWLGVEGGQEPWPAVAAACALERTSDLTMRGRLLGLPVSRLGETRARPLGARKVRMAPASGKAPSRGSVKVVDLSSLWAGPLCGALFADAGAEVVKVESRARPDSGRESGEAFFARFNRRKRLLSLDFANPDDLAGLREMVAGADVLITSARARAFAGLGLAPDAVFATNPALTWIAITGYGFVGSDCDRVAFGDDAAVAGGLVRRDLSGQPSFFGDAPGDPLTGLAAAVGGFNALANGGGILVDAAMARASASALHA